MKQCLAILLVLLLCGCQAAQFDAECTLSVTCAQVTEHMEELTAEKAELIPQDGMLFADTVAFESGEDLLTVMSRALKEAKLPMVTETTPGTGGAYVSSLGSLAPGDCGPMSGWMFTVNGAFPSESCDKILLQDGDVIEWTYVCEWTE